MMMVSDGCSEGKRLPSSVNITPLSLSQTYLTYNTNVGLGVIYRHYISYGITLCYQGKMSSL